MNEILKTTASRVISSAIIILLLCVSLNYFFGGDGVGSKERLDNITNTNEATKSEIDRVIVDLEESGARVERIEAGNSRAQELIADIQRDLDEAERILKGIIERSEAGTT